MTTTGMELFHETTVAICRGIPVGTSMGSGWRVRKGIQVWGGIREDLCS